MGGNVAPETEINVDVTLTIPMDAFTFDSDNYVDDIRECGCEIDEYNIVSYNISGIEPTLMGDDVGAKNYSVEVRACFSDTYGDGDSNDDETNRIGFES